MRLMPGDIIDARIAQLEEIGAPLELMEKHRAALMKEYGLDVPILTQYGRWLGVYPQADGGFSGLFQGDFGDSLVRKSSVIEDIATRAEKYASFAFNQSHRPWLYGLALP